MPISTAGGAVASVATPPPSVQAIQATGSILAWNSVVEIGATNPTANMSLTLPGCTAADVGKSILFKRLDATAFTVTVVAPSGQTTDIVTTTVLNVRYGAIRVTVAAAGRSVQTDDLQPNFTSNSVFTGPTAGAAGTMGLVPAPAITDRNKGLTAAAQFGSVLLGMQVLTASGLYQPSPGTTMIRGYIVGGGGGGAGVSGNNTPNASGGGSAGGTRVFLESVADTSTYNVTIGAGGTVTLIATGGAGGDSSVTVNGTTYTGKGGPGGRYLAPTPPTSKVGDAIEGALAEGGSASTAHSLPGQHGQTALQIALGIQISGAGGDSPFGRGGMPGNFIQSTQNGVAGNNGVGYGAGGSGANQWAGGRPLGGLGAAGVFVVFEYR